jgi:hypothetical protein
MFEGDKNSLPEAHVPKEWLDPSQDAPEEQSVEPSEEQVVSTVAKTETVASHPAQSSAQESFRALREKAERAERNEREMMRRLQELEARNAPPTLQDEEIRLNPDDLVEGKHFKAQNAQFEKKIKQLQQQVEAYQKNSVEITTETRLKSQYPDFDRVVSRENIERLQAEYPDLAESIGSSPDLYKKASSAYTLIKKLGIHQEDTFMNERNRVQQNMAKPKPLASVSPQQGESPLAKANAFANGLTKEMQDKLLKEMQEARKGY